MNLNAISATTPKIPDTAIKVVAGPKYSNGLSRRSKSAVTAWLTAFMPIAPSRRIRSPTSRDVAEAAQFLGDVCVALRAFELSQLVLEHVHDELLVRRVAGDRRDLLDAIEEVLFELDLVAAEHV